MGEKRPICMAIKTSMHALTLNEIFVWKFQKLIAQTNPCKKKSETKHIHYVNNKNERL